MDASSPSASPSHKKARMDTDDLGSTFNSFLKRISKMEEDEGRPGGGRFPALLSELKSPDRTAQLVALGELSECLSVSSEELLISFPIDSFMHVLVRILDDPGEDDAAATRMVLCCRCMHNVIDILPQISGIVIAAGALPVICSKLLNIEFIDVAEICVQILDLISEDQPLPVLKAGGFCAVLTYVEFFPQSIQRQAAQAAGKMLSVKASYQQFQDFVRPVFPTLVNFMNSFISLQNGSDLEQQVQQAICECWRRALDLVQLHFDTSCFPLTPRQSSGAHQKGGVGSYGKQHASIGNMPHNMKGEKGGDIHNTGNSRFPGNSASLGPLSKDLFNPSKWRHNNSSRSREAEKGTKGGGQQQQQQGGSALAGPSGRDACVSGAPGGMTNSGASSHCSSTPSSGNNNASPSTSASVPLCGGSSSAQAFLNSMSFPPDFLKQLQGAGFNNPGADKVTATETSDQVLADILPDHVFEAFLLLLSDKVGSLSRSVYEEVLYIVSAVCAMSDALSLLALQQNIGQILYANLARDVSPTLIISVIISILPCVQLNDDGLFEVNSKRLAIFQTNSDLLKNLIDLFLGKLLHICHDPLCGFAPAQAGQEKVDQSMRPLALSTVLSCILVARFIPQVLDSVNPVEMCKFAATSLNNKWGAINPSWEENSKNNNSSMTSKPSKSEVLAAITIVKELLDSHWSNYAELFVKHGVIQNLARFVTPKRRGKQKKRGKRPSLTIIIQDIAAEILNKYYNNPVNVSDSVMVLERAAELLVTGSYDEAFRELQRCLEKEDISGFQFVASKMPDALLNFFKHDTHSRLELFIKEMNVKNDSAIFFGKLCRLCVEAVSTLEQLPVKIYQSTGNSGRLPLHLRPESQRMSQRESEKNARNKGGVMSSGGPNINLFSAHSSLYLLKLMSKPFKARLVPKRRDDERQLDELADELRSFENLAGLSFFESAQSRLDEESGGSAGSDGRPPILGTGSPHIAAAGISQSLRPFRFNPPGSSSWSLGGSLPGCDGKGKEGPASRLRNYFAQKMLRVKRMSDGGVKKEKSPIACPRGGNNTQGELPPMDFPPLGDNNAKDLKNTPIQNTVMGDNNKVNNNSTSNSNNNQNIAMDGGGGNNSTVTSGGAAGVVSGPAAGGKSQKRSGHSAMSGGNPTSDSKKNFLGNALQVASAASACHDKESMWHEKESMRAARMDSDSLRARMEKEPFMPSAMDRDDLESFGIRPPEVSLLLVEPLATLSQLEEFVLQSEKRAPNSPTVQVDRLDSAPMGNKKVVMYSPQKSEVALNMDHSMIQVLLNEEYAKMKVAPASDEIERGRFLVCDAQEGSQPKRLQCASLWSKIHLFSYEIVEGDQSSSTDSKSNDASTHAEMFPDPFTKLEAQIRSVSSTFEPHKWREALAPLSSSLADNTTTTNISTSISIPFSHTGSSTPTASASASASANSGGGPSCKDGDKDKSIASKEKESSKKSVVQNASQAGVLTLDSADQSEGGDPASPFLRALELVAVMHSISQYINESVPNTVPRDFISPQLSAKINVSLSDPLSVATRTVPAWCLQLGQLSFLLPPATRNYLHHCCGLGVSRGLNFLQSRIVSSCSHSPEMKKKLESEIHMGSIPRQKVRISRSRMLESAIKLMNLYGNKKPALEVEYQGEVGTGIGPTLEFYASVAEELKNGSVPAEPITRHSLSSPSPTQSTSNCSQSTSYNNGPSHHHQYPPPPRSIDTSMNPHDDGLPSHAHNMNLTGGAGLNLTHNPNTSTWSPASTTSSTSPSSSGTAGAGVLCLDATSATSGPSIMTHAHGSSMSFGSSPSGLPPILPLPDTPRGPSSPSPEDYPELSTHVDGAGALPPASRGHGSIMVSSKAMQPVSAGSSVSQAGIASNPNVPAVPVRTSSGGKQGDVDDMHLGSQHQQQQQNATYNNMHQHLPLLRREVTLFRKGVPLDMLFPLPMASSPIRWTTSATHTSTATSTSPIRYIGPPAGAAGDPILERFVLMGQLIAKGTVDSRLVDLNVHPIMWNLVRGVDDFSKCLFHKEMLRDVDPILWDSLQKLREMSADELDELCLDFTLPGHTEILLVPSGNQKRVTSENVDQYIFLVAKVSLIDSVKQQISAFREGFTQCLPLSAVSMWNVTELGSLIVGSAGNDNEYWTFEYLARNIKPMHGYKSDSKVFLNLLRVMSRFTLQERRAFLAFCTGSPTLPKKGFAALKPALVVVKREAPSESSPDDFLPSVMTCANYLKLPLYSTEEVLEAKLKRAIKDGQGAFLLS